MDVLLALLPLSIVLVLMAGLRWKSLYAGAAGWAMAILVAHLYFGAGVNLLFWTQVRGLTAALPILCIIWGALFFYRATEAAGTIDALVQRLQHLSPHRERQALILAWGFAAFLQGVGGFGVPVAIVAPLILALGYDPVTAVLLPALGHTWAISFGSLGASFLALSSVVAVEKRYLAFWMALFLALVALLGGWRLLRLLRLPLRHNFPLWALMGGVMGGVQLTAASLGLWNLAALLGALAGLLTVFLLIEREPSHDELSLPPLSRLAPYAILLGLIVALRLIAPLRNLFDVLQLQLRIPPLIAPDGHRIPATTTAPFSLFGNTGALLFYASVATLFLARRWGHLDRRRLLRLGRDFRRSALPSGAGLLVMILLGTTMDGAGMIDLLAQALIRAADGLFAPLAPWLGALVALVTGSNIASNLLMGALQARMALLTGLAVGPILGMQNVGAALGSILSPAKLIVGCSTVGMGGREAVVMRRLLRELLPWLLLLSLLSWGIA